MFLFLAVTAAHKIVHFFTWKLFIMFQVVVVGGGEKLNYKSVAKEISKPPFFGS